MKQRSLITALILLIAIITTLGCNLTAALAEPTDTPTDLSAVKPLEQAAAPTATAPAATPTEPLTAFEQASTLMAMVTPLPTPVVPSGWITEKVRLTGFHEISHPAEYTFLVDERTSADGVRFASPNTVTIINPSPENHFVITIENKEFGTTIAYAPEIASRDDPCIAEYPPSPFILPQWQHAFIHIDTGCGLYGTTVIYMADTYIGQTYFRVSIESHHPYSEIQAAVEAVLVTAYIETPRPFRGPMPSPP